MARGSAKITVLPARNATSAARTATPYALFGLDTLDRFPGPALVVDQSLRVLQANVHAGLLMEALEAASGPVATLIRRTFAHDAPIVHKLSLLSRSGAHHIELFALPTTIAKSTRAKATMKVVAVLCRDMTLEQNLTQSLVTSRQMFKDLLTCSGDFAWETDADGVLRYVSPKGGFGYGAHEMAGRLASDFLAPPHPAQNPFAARDKGQSGTYSLLNGDGSVTEVHVVAVPVVDTEGHWQGARGICRDVSDHARRDAALRQLMKLETLRAALLSLAAKTAGPMDLLSEAVSLISDHMGFQVSGFLFGEQGLASVDTGSLALDVQVRSHLTALSDAAAHPAKSVRIMPADGQTYTLSALRVGMQTLGALAVHGDNAAADDHPSAPLETISDTLALLLDHARLNNAINRTPVINDLHRLLDRAAFAELLAERLDISQRTGQVAVVEIDGWHAFAAQADESVSMTVLNDFAAHLHSTARGTDLVAWLGDGRFALWLERSDTPGAVAKIERMKRILKELALPNGVAQSRLTLSAGIAPWTQPGLRAPADELITKAVDALKSACRHGRGHWAVATDIPLPGRKPSSEI